MVAVLYRRLRVPVERLLADPQRELERDVWRLGMLRPDAGGQTVDYTAITQPWLRGLVKQWNQQRLVSHSVGLLRLDAYVGIALSNVLGLRPDGGEDPSLLGRQDVVDFLVHLKARQLRGEITNAHQRNCITRLRAMLRDARERGLHRQPGPLAGLSEEFAFLDADVPRRLARDVEGEPGAGVAAGGRSTSCCLQRRSRCCASVPVRRWRVRSSCRCAPAVGRRRSRTHRSGA